MIVFYILKISILALKNFNFSPLEHSDKNDEEYLHGLLKKYDSENELEIHSYNEKFKCTTLPKHNISHKNMMSQSIFSRQRPFQHFVSKK